jgi:uncharacterized membrane protein YgcG
MSMRLLVALALCCVRAAAADERILDYHSDIRVLTDSGVEVTETIRVRAEGVRIKRGIFREFPTIYTDDGGERTTVSFEVRGVRRDGASEAYRLERRANGVVVYAGQADRFVSPGEHVYEIRYRTDRQLGFFDDHDELYWNVTGVGWIFPIDQATASVHLPDATAYDRVRFEAYTGPQGARGRNYRAQLGEGGVEFETTRALGANEGITIVVGWPKGLVRAPGAIARLRYFVRDNVPLAAAVLGLLAVFAYYVLVWRRYGRDPQPGVIIPRYRPPQGETPASMRYLERQGYDNRCFVAGILSLAVKGYLVIEQEKGGLFRKDSYVLRRTGQSQTLLLSDEQVLYQILLGDRELLELRKDNYAVLSSASATHESVLQRQHREKNFRLNRIWRYLGLALTAVVLFGGIIGAARANGYGPEWFLTTQVGWATVAIALLGLLTNRLFGRVMPAPTREGRRRLDEIEGFKLYLEVAEGDELKLAGAPRKTPQLYETYLPFALALGVSQAWSEQFAKVFLMQPNYTPQWYTGERWDVSDVGSFSSSLSSSFSSAVESASIASSSSAPGESSGFSFSVGGGDSDSGGSSGGGGGGGGGGGW